MKQTFIIEYEEKNRIRKTETTAYNHNKAIEHFREKFPALIIRKCKKLDSVELTGIASYDGGEFYK